MSRPVERKLSAGLEEKEFATAERMQKLSCVVGTVTGLRTLPRGHVKRHAIRIIQRVGIGVIESRGAVAGSIVN